MCEVLKVDDSNYYRWLKNGMSKREKENQMLSIEIKQIFTDSKETYGSPRVTADLRNRGKIVSEKRIRKLMRKNNLRSKIRRKYKATTDSKHLYPVAENLLNRNFNPETINTAWVSDITYIRTLQGWLYLTIVLDLFDKQIIGWALSKTLKTKDTIIPAFSMAISKRKITENLIFHSDRGVQYACVEFTELLKKHPKIKQSMSRKGNCWDNAVAETFFKTLKVECVYLNKYFTVADAEISIFEYIETWYNSKRLHSSLGYKSPEQFEAYILNNKFAA